MTLVLWQRHRFNYLLHNNPRANPVRAPKISRVCLICCGIGTQFNLVRILFLISSKLPLYSHRSLLGGRAPFSPCFIVFSTSPYLDYRPRSAIHVTSSAQSRLHACHQTSHTCPRWHVPYLAIQAFHKHFRQFPDG